MFHSEADKEATKEPPRPIQLKCNDGCEVKIKEEPVSPASFEEEGFSDAEENRKRSSSDDEKGPEYVRAQVPRPSPHRKETETFKSSLELLQRIFPHQSKAILELILGACEEDVVKAIESLLPENNPRPFPLPMPLRGYRSGPLISCDGSTKSAFSPITKSPPYVYPGPLPAQAQSLKSPCDKSPGTPSAFQPIHSCSPPEHSPSMAERFQFPVVAGYFFNRPGSSALLPLNSAQQRNGPPPPGSKFCGHCGFSSKVGDKFCSECGKLLE